MCADGPARGDGAGARPRLTGAVVLAVLGPGAVAIAAVVTINFLAGTGSPTMALWVLVLATWLGNLGYFVSAIPVSDTVLARARPGRAAQ